MVGERTVRFMKIAFAAVFVLVLGAALVGCSNSTTEAASGTSTAMGTLSIAQSALSTMAPDAKLLVVQTANVVTTTSTPVWEYLFGSPASNLTYLVFVQDGVATPYEYGEASLAATQWAQVPETSEWKIDSDEAHSKALAFGNGSASASYVMGFVTYLPDTSTSVVAPMAWDIMFNPDATSTADMSEFTVDVRTGKVSTLE